MSNNFKQILSGIIYIFKEQLKKIRDAKYNKFYPYNPRHDDVYIVEFPKSGVTWLSTLVSNINLIESKQNIDITIYNVHQYVPDIHTLKNLSFEPLWDFPKFRIIKSHDQYNLNYGFVIYLLRHPVDIMKSYYVFISNLGLFNGTFYEFVTHPKYGINKWVEHVNGWLYRTPTYQRIHILRYEDLVKDPEETLEKVYKNLGLKVNEDTLSQAVEKSSLKLFGATEEFYKTNYKQASELKNSFVRKTDKREVVVDELSYKVIIQKSRHVLADYYGE